MSYSQVPKASPLVELHIQQKNYRKHVNSLRTMKPFIDTSRPTTAPRILHYRQRITHERIVQMQIDNENIRLIKETYNEHENLRKSAFCKSHKTIPRVNNWVNEIDEQKVILGMEKQTPNSNLRLFSSSNHSDQRPTTSSSLSQSKSSIISSQSNRRKVMKDDGMTVVDESIRSRPSPQMVRPFKPRKTRQAPIFISSNKSNHSKPNLSPINELQDIPLDDETPQQPENNQQSTRNFDHYLSERNHQVNIPPTPPKTPKMSICANEDSTINVKAEEDQISTENFVFETNENLFNYTPTQEASKVPYEGEQLLKPIATSKRNINEDIEQNGNNQENGIMTNILETINSTLVTQEENQNADSSQEKEPTEIVNQTETKENNNENNDKIEINNDKLEISNNEVNNQNESKNEEVDNNEVNDQNEIKKKEVDNTEPKNSEINDNKEENNNEINEQNDIKSQEIVNDQQKDIPKEVDNNNEKATSTTFSLVNSVVASIENPDSKKTEENLEESKSIAKEENKQDQIESNQNKEDSNQPDPNNTENESNQQESSHQNVLNNILDNTMDILNSTQQSEEKDKERSLQQNQNENDKQETKPEEIKQQHNEEENPSQSIDSKQTEIGNNENQEIAEEKEMQNDANKSETISLDKQTFEVISETNPKEKADDESIQNGVDCGSRPPQQTNENTSMNNEQNNGEVQERNVNNDQQSIKTLNNNINNDEAPKRTTNNDQKEEPPIGNVQQKHITTDDQKPTTRSNEINNQNETGNSDTSKDTQQPNQLLGMFNQITDQLASKDEDTETKNEAQPNASVNNNTTKIQHPTVDKQITHSIEIESDVNQNNASEQSESSENDNNKPQPASLLNKVSDVLSSTMNESNKPVNTNEVSNQDVTLEDSSIQTREAPIINSQQQRETSTNEVKSENQTNPDHLKQLLPKDANQAPVVKGTATKTVNQPAQQKKDEPQQPKKIIKSVEPAKEKLAQPAPQKEEKDEKKIIELIQQKKEEKTDSIQTENPVEDKSLESIERSSKDESQKKSTQPNVFSAINNTLFTMASTNNQTETKQEILTSNSPETTEEAVETNEKGKEGQQKASQKESKAKQIVKNEETTSNGQKSENNQNMKSPGLFDAVSTTLSAVSPNTQNQIAIHENEKEKKAVAAKEVTTEKQPKAQNKIEATEIKVEQAEIQKQIDKPYQNNTEKDLKKVNAKTANKQEANHVKKGQIEQKNPDEKKDEIGQIEQPIVEKSVEQTKSSTQSTGLIETVKNTLSAVASKNQNEPKETKSQETAEKRVDSNEVEKKVVESNTKDVKVEQKEEQPNPKEPIAIEKKDDKVEQRVDQATDKTVNNTSKPSGLFAAVNSTLSIVTSKTQNETKETEKKVDSIEVEKKGETTEKKVDSIEVEKKGETTEKKVDSIEVEKKGEKVKAKKKAVNRKKDTKVEQKEEQSKQKDPVAIEKKNEKVEQKVDQTANQSVNANNIRKPSGLFDVVNNTLSAVTPKNQNEPKETKSQETTEKEVDSNELEKKDEKDETKKTAAQQNSDTKLQQKDDQIKQEKETKVVKSGINNDIAKSSGLIDTVNNTLSTVSPKNQKGIRASKSKDITNDQEKKEEKVGQPKKESKPQPKEERNVEKSDSTSNNAAKSSNLFDPLNNTIATVSSTNETKEIKKPETEKKKEPTVKKVDSNEVEKKEIESKKKAVNPKKDAKVEQKVVQPKKEVESNKKDDVNPKKDAKVEQKEEQPKQKDPVAIEKKDEKVEQKVDQTANQSVNANNTRKPSGLFDVVNNTLSAVAPKNQNEPKETKSQETTEKEIDSNELEKKEEKVEAQKEENIFEQEEEEIGDKTDNANTGNAKSSGLIDTVNNAISLVSPKNQSEFQNPQPEKKEDKVEKKTVNPKDVKKKEDQIEQKSVKAEIEKKEETDQTKEKQIAAKEQNPVLKNDKVEPNDGKSATANNTTTTKSPKNQANDKVAPEQKDLPTPPKEAPSNQVKKIANGPPSTKETEQSNNQTTEKKEEQIKIKDQTPGLFNTVNNSLSLVSGKQNEQEKQVSKNQGKEAEANIESRESNTKKDTQNKTNEIEVRTIEVEHDNQQTKNEQKKEKEPVNKPTNSPKEDTGILGVIASFTSDNNPNPEQDNPRPITSSHGSRPTTASRGSRSRGSSRQDKTEVNGNQEHEGSSHQFTRPDSSQGNRSGSSGAAQHQSTSNHTTAISDNNSTYQSRAPLPPPNAPVTLNWANIFRGGNFGVPSSSNTSNVAPKPAPAPATRQPAPQRQPAKPNQMKKAAGTDAQSILGGLFRL